MPEVEGSTELTIGNSEISLCVEISLVDVGNGNKEVVVSEDSLLFLLF